MVPTAGIFITLYKYDNFFLIFLIVFLKLLFCYIFSLVKHTKVAVQLRSLSCVALTDQFML